MKKARLLGAVVSVALAGGLGYAVAAATGALAPAQAPARVEYQHTLTPSSVLPAANGTVYSSDKITQVVYTFPVKGDDGIGLHRSADSFVTISKDGVQIASYPTTDETNVCDSRNYLDQLIIKLPETATAGVYEVTIPAGLVYFEFIGAVDEGEEAPLPSDNPTITTTFTVLPSADYSWAPANGEVMAENLNTIRINYPEGATIALAEAAEGETLPAAALWTYNPQAGYDAEEKPLPTDSQLTEMGVAVDGNAVVLTAADPSAIVSFTTRGQYDYLKVPAGLWTVTVDGTDFTNPALTIGEWAVREFNAANFTWTPNNAEIVNAADLTELRATYPAVLENNKTAINPKTVAATLYVSGGTASGSDVAYTYYLADIVDEGQTLVLKMIEPTTSSRANRPEYVQTGKHNLDIAANTFKLAASGKANTKITLSNLFDVQGIEQDIVWKTSSPNNNSAITTATGMTGFTLNFIQKSRVVADSEAVMELFEEGNDTPVATVAVSATTTAAAKAGAAGSITAAYKFASPVKSAKTLTLKVPAGAFEQTTLGQWTNAAAEFVYYNPNDVEHSFIPAGGATAAEAVDMASIPASIQVVYPEGAVCTPIPGASAASCSLGGGSKNNYGCTIECEGNVVTATFANSIVDAAATTNYMVSLTAGLWSVSYNGENNVNPALKQYYTIHTPSAGTVNPEAGSKVEASELAVVDYYGLQSSWPGTGGAVLKDSEGNTVVSYTASKPNNDNGDIANYSYLVRFTANADELAALKTPGDYTFEINQEGVLVGSATNAKLMIYNQVPYTYQFELVPTIPSTELAYYIDGLYMPVNDQVDLQFTSSFERFGFRISSEYGELIAVDYTSGVEGTLTAPDGTSYPFQTGTADNPNVFLGDYGISMEETEVHDWILGLDVPGNVKVMEGDYTLTIPTGMLTIYGQPLEAYSKTYTIYKSEADMYTLSPAAGEVETLDNITVAAKDGLYVDYSTSGVPDVTLTHADGTQVTAGKWPKGAGAYGVGSLTFQFTAPEGGWAEGQWTFNIPEGYLNFFSDIYDMDSMGRPGTGNSPEINVVYIIKDGTGVRMVGAQAADSYTVHTTDGRAVMIDAAPEKMKELAPGLYIVNGRKVLINK